MEKKIVTKEIYVALDGEVFDNEADCHAHEVNLGEHFILEHESSNYVIDDFGIPDCSCDVAIVKCETPKDCDLLNVGAEAIFNRDIHQCHAILGHTYVIGLDAFYAYDTEWIEKRIFDAFANVKEII